MTLKVLNNRNSGIDAGTGNDSCELVVVVTERQGAWMNTRVFAIEAGAGAPNVSAGKI
jgi:hypothetical protein